MDQKKLARLTPEELIPAVLEGATIYGPQDETVGTVVQLNGSGLNQLVIVEVGDFLGIGAKSVAVSINSLDFMRTRDGEVRAVTAWSRDELKAMPEYRLD